MNIGAAPLPSMRVARGDIDVFGFWSMFIFIMILMFIFIMILTVGFTYEWKKGALEWQ